jgi:hypothetical protein
MKTTESNPVDASQGICYRIAVSTVIIQSVQVVLIIGVGVTGLA